MKRRNQISAPERSKRARRLLILLGLGVAAVATTLVFLNPLRVWVSQRAILYNDAPRSDLIEEMILAADDPSDAILAAWNAKKIVHRQAAVRYAPLARGSDGEFPPRIRDMLLAGALDADLNVREAALAHLAAASDPDLPALAAAQLDDIDPQTRLLGLRYIKSAAPELGVPAVAPLVDDADLLIVSMALNLLERWSDEEFGVKLADAVPVVDPAAGRSELAPERRAKVLAGAERARAWWNQRSASFSEAALERPRRAPEARDAIAAPDFRLPTLAGRHIRLSDLRGRVVLINFWTTWCGACLEEIPRLIELQERHGRQLTVLGVSLDAIPDVHGHIGGHETSASEPLEAEGSRAEGRHGSALKELEEKVARKAKRLGINYPVLLDFENRAGGIYNGGELPTTVIVGPDGFVRRRFVGARTLPVFEAMAADAARPRASGAER